MVNNCKASIQEKKTKLSAYDVPDTMKGSENKEVETVGFIYKKSVSSMGTEISNLKIGKNQDRHKPKTHRSLEGFSHLSRVCIFPKGNGV